MATASRNSHFDHYATVTVVLPVYNGENFLAPAVESVLFQTCPATQIIVIDDGSTDNTAAVAARFGDRIQLYRQKNVGLANSRNRAISLAQTEWVALLDHDDVWKPDHLENILKAIAAEPEADVCYTGFQLLARHPETGEFQPAAETLPVPPADKVRDVLLERCPFKPSCVALRKSTVEKAGGFDPQRRYGEDWDLWLRLVRGGAKFTSCPEPTLLYRVHSASMTNNPEFALQQTRQMLEEELIPYLPLWKRLWLGQRVFSRLEAEAAILLRENGTPGALALMLRSILRYPLFDRRRYKVAMHMMLRSYPLTTIAPESDSQDESWSKAA